MFGKNAAHRYRSAGELAADLNRFLQGHPILARRTPAYRKAIMWAKRKPALASFVAFFAISISGWLIAATVYNRHISQQNIQITKKKDQLQEELDRSKRIIAESRKLSRWLLRDFSDSLSSGAGVTSYRSQLANRTQKHFDNLIKEASGDTELKIDIAGAFTTLANLQGNFKSDNLGQYKEALETLKKAEKILTTLKKPLNARANRYAASLHIQLANLAQYSGDYQEASRQSKLAQAILKNKTLGLKEVDRLGMLLDVTATDFWLIYQNRDPVAVKKQLKKSMSFVKKLFQRSTI